MPPRFRHLGDVTRHHAAARGTKVALRFQGSDTTFAELHKRSCQVASGLRALGVNPGTRVAYLGKNSAAYYEILFGAAAAGAVLVPVNRRLSMPELEWILRDCGAAVLFAGADVCSEPSRLVAQLPALHRTLLLDDPLGYSTWRDAQPNHDGVITVQPEDVVVQLYTSGTTGTPKGAMLSHRALLHFRSLPPEAQPAWNRWTDDDVSLIVMPQFHIGGTGFGLQTLCAGATGLVQTEFDAGVVLDLIERERLSKIFAVPAALQMILRHPRARGVNYARIRTIVYGASPMPLDLLREAMEVFGCGFVQQYGMTETSGSICVLPPEDHEGTGNERMRSAGKPLPGVEIRILDGGGTSLPSGMTGEIVLRCPTLMSGYWNLPEATRDAFTAEGFFRTGDVGKLDAQGYLYILDRVKDMIVTGGENVYPAEVEAVLRSHPAVIDVVVIGVPDEKWGEAVKAVVVPNTVRSADPQQILNWARNRLAGFKLPKSIDFVTELPRNATGKVLRRALRDPYWADRTRRVN